MADSLKKLANSPTISRLSLFLALLKKILRLNPAKRYSISMISNNIWIRKYVCRNGHPQTLPSPRAQIEDGYPIHLRR